MPDRKPFLLRIDREVLDGVQRWADDDLRSLNGQIEFLLRRALAESGRVRPPARDEVSASPPAGQEKPPDNSQTTGDRDAGDET